MLAAANLAKRQMSKVPNMDIGKFTDQIPKGINMDTLKEQAQKMTGNTIIPNDTNQPVPPGSTPSSSSSAPPHFTYPEVDQIKAAIDKVFEKRITQAKLSQLMAGWFDSLKLSPSQLSGLASKFMDVLGPSLQQDFVFKRAILKQLLADQEIRSLVDDSTLRPVAGQSTDFVQNLKKLLERRFTSGGAEAVANPAISPAEELLNLKLERLVEADLPKIFDEAMQKYVERYATTPNADIDRAIREKALTVIGSLPIANFKFFILYNLLQDSKMIKFINEAVAGAADKAYSIVLLSAIAVSFKEPLPITNPAVPTSYQQTSITNPAVLTSSQQTPIPNQALPTRKTAGKKRTKTTKKYKRSNKKTRRHH